MHESTYSVDVYSIIQRKSVMFAYENEILLLVNISNHVQSNQSTIKNCLSNNDHDSIVFLQNVKTGPKTVSYFEALELIAAKTEMFTLHRSTHSIYYICLTYIIIFLKILYITYRCEFAMTLFILCENVMHYNAQVCLAKLYF